MVGSLLFRVIIPIEHIIVFLKNKIMFLKNRKDLMDNKVASCCLQGSKSARSGWLLAETAVPKFSRNESERSSASSTSPSLPSKLDNLRIYH